MASGGMFGNWGRLDGILKNAANAARWQASVHRAMLREALRLQGKMKRAFNQGGPPGAKWEPLSETTLKFRRALGFRGTKPLMRSGDMRNSITVVEPGPMTVFVGFHRNTYTKDGQQAWYIAAIHEFGTKRYAINVTPAMRGFFEQLNVASGGEIRPLSQQKTVIIVQIPARPTVGPIWDAEHDASARRILGDTLAGIGLAHEARLLGLRG